MFPISGPQNPDNPTALASALQGGLAAHGVTVAKVQAEGGWPALSHLGVDFTGTRFTRELRIPSGGEAAGDVVSAAKFELTGQPAFFEATPVEIKVAADGAGFRFGQTAAGEQMLLLETADRGDVAIEIRRADLEALLQSLASDAAGKQGVEVKKTTLELTSKGPRLLAFRAQVSAKMFIVTASVTVSGELEVDDHLVARLSNLQFSGDGMIANVAGGYIRPQLEKLEGRTFSLMAFSLGTIRLKDVRLSGGESLKMEAAFGS